VVRFADSNAEWSPDGKSFLFISDRDGAADVYLHQPGPRCAPDQRRNGVSVPGISPDGDRFLANVYERGEFHTYEFPVRNRPDGCDAAAAARHHPGAVESLSRERKGLRDQPYRTKFGIDFVGAGIAIDPSAGDVGNGGQLVMTDLLGNHQINLIFGTTTDQFDRISTTSTSPRRTRISRTTCTTRSRASI
jgi:hypothetical protein